jgi:hypothetical protein
VRGGSGLVNYILILVKPPGALTTLNINATTHATLRKTMVDVSIQRIGFVYGIKSIDLIKVGVAQDIEQRMHSMRLDNPHELKLVFRRKSRAPYTLERQMHRLLADKAVGREWFRCTVEDVRAAAYTAKLETARIETVYRQKFRIAVVKREKLAHCVKTDGGVSSIINTLDPIC